MCFVRVCVCATLVSNSMHSTCFGMPAATLCNIKRRKAMALSSCAQVRIRKVFQWKTRFTWRTLVSNDLMAFPSFFERRAAASRSNIAMRLCTSHCAACLRAAVLSTTGRPPEGAFSSTRAQAKQYRFSAVPEHTVPKRNLQTWCAATSAFLQSPLSSNVYFLSLLTWLGLWNGWLQPGYSLDVLAPRKAAENPKHQQNKSFLEASRRAPGRRGGR